MLYDVGVVLVLGMDFGVYVLCDYICLFYVMVYLWFEEVVDWFVMLFG